MSRFASLALVDCGLPKQWGNPFPHRSLGLLSCQRFLERRGIAAQLIGSDEVGAGLPFEAGAVEPLVSRLAGNSPDFIGFTTTSDNLPVVLYLAERIKLDQRRPKARIVLGGIGASSYPRALLDRFPFLDLIVVGEGEQTLLELLAAGGDPTAWSEVPGLVYRDAESGIRESAPRPRFADLGQLPMPFSFSRYQIPGFRNERQTCFAVSSRGCTGHCHFCSHSLIWKGEVTHHPASQVLDLMAEIQSRHPGAHLAFQDDDFLSDMDKIKLLAAGIEKRRLETPISIFGRLDRINRPLLELLARTNCDSIIFGLDAVTEHGRRELGKPWSPSDALDRIQLTREVIPSIEINLIYGWAEESRDDFRTLVREAYALRMAGIQVKLAPLAVYPGTPIHRRYAARHELRPDARQFGPVYREAFDYVTAHPSLFPHFCANSFDPDYPAKKRLLAPLAEAFTIFDEV